MVVDDSVVARRLVSDILNQDDELEVVGTAANGRIALAKRDTLKPDLVTKDAEMPELDGVETVRAMRMEAGDGQQGLDVLADGPLPHLACVDWHMPVMDGLTFITRVRAAPEWRDTTLMIVTTKSEYSLIVRALAAGAHEHLIKPFTAQAMAVKLELHALVPGYEVSELLS